ncbi:MAG: hypothetical protein V4568_13370 [Pseudomonadota bacterium]
MKINLSELQNKPSDYNGTGSSNGELNRQKWLREIEQARTEMMGSMRAVTPAAVRLDGYSEHSAGGALDCKNTPQQSMEGIRQYRAAQTESNATKLLDNVSIQEVARGISEIESGPVINRGGILPSPLVNYIDARSEARLAAVDVHSDLTQTLWDKENFHIETTADGVVVWVRNAKLNTEDEARIIEQLRRNLSELGMRLCRLYLNGRSVTLEALNTNQSI